MMTTKAQIKASDKYNKANTRSLCIRINTKTESELIAHLDKIENKAGYIKRLIAEDMRRG